MNQTARPRRVKGLGEVSIRVRDLDAMHKFYEEVVARSLVVLLRPSGESAGVCLLRCQRGVGHGRARTFHQALDWVI